MEIAALAASLLRRWYIVVAGVILTAVLGALAVQAVPPTYSAAGSVLLLPPRATVDEGSNQLLQLGGLEQPASLVVAYLAGDNMRTAFGTQHPGATYDVVLDPLSRGPLIMMTVHSPSSATVMQALDSAIETVPEALDALQDEVAAPPSSRFSSMPLSIDVEPVTENKSSLRALIAAVGVGMALTLVGAVGLDSLLVGRGQRRATKTAGGAGAPDLVPPDADQGPQVRQARVEQPDVPVAVDPTKDSSQGPSTARRRNTEWIPVTRDDATSGAGAPHIAPRS